MSESAFFLFITTSLVLLITPGPAIIYIVARSLSQGWLAGLVATLGISFGALVHVIAAAVGLSQILLTSALAFSVIKYLGAAYLVYLGVKTLLRRDASAPITRVDPRALSVIFRESLVVNLFNPKVALFFFAFLPQFVDPALGSGAAQIISLGLIFILMGVITDGLYALSAGFVVQRLKQGGMSLGRYLSGLIYIALGLFTALFEPGQQRGAVP